MLQAKLLVGQMRIGKQCSMGSDSSGDVALAVFPYFNNPSRKDICEKQMHHDAREPFTMLVTTWTHASWLPDLCVDCLVAEVVE